MRECKVRPLGTRVIVELDELPGQIGSIYLPDGAYMEAEGFATVLRVGPGHWTKSGKRIPVPLEEGDRVLVIRLHERTSTQEGLQAVPEIGPGRLVLNALQDILGVVEDEGPEPQAQKAQSSGTPNP